MKIANISEKEATMHGIEERMTELEKENDMKFNDTFKVGFTVGFLDCMEYLADELEGFKKGLEEKLKKLEERNIPKIPYNSNDNINIIICPTCTEQVGEWTLENGNEVYEVLYKFCPGCGQALEDGPDIFDRE